MSAFQNHIPEYDESNESIVDALIAELEQDPDIILTLDRESFEEIDNDTDLEELFDR